MNMNRVQNSFFHLGLIHLMHIHLELNGLRHIHLGLIHLRHIHLGLTDLLHIHSEHIHNIHMCVLTSGIQILLPEYIPSFT